MLHKLERALARRAWANPARVSQLAVPNGKAKRQSLEKKMSSRLCYQNHRRKLQNPKVCNMVRLQSADCICHKDISDSSATTVLLGRGPLQFRYRGTAPCNPVQCCQCILPSFIDIKQSLVITADWTCISALPVCALPWFTHSTQMPRFTYKYRFVVGSQADARTAKIKWKKLANRAITAAGGKMKIKKLQKQLLQDNDVLPPQHAVAMEQLMTQLVSSKQFTIAGSSVTLTMPSS